MVEFQIQIKSKDGGILAEESNTEECRLVYAEEYQEGDTIIVKSSRKNIHIHLMLDDVLGDSFVYMVTNEFVYTIPFGEKKVSYSPKAFEGKCCHLLEVRMADEDEIGAYRNLAFNMYDQHGEQGVYPHAFANVETRGESVFAARNAIDGNRHNTCHGVWPFESWGINMQDDAWLRLDFGQEICTGKIKLYTRADFPHDNWWEKVTISFSDETSMVCNLTKKSNAHEILFEKRNISWLCLSNLIKADDPSPFPALSQIEVFGVVMRKRKENENCSIRA